MPGNTERWVLLARVQAVGVQTRATEHTDHTEAFSEEGTFEL